LEGIIAYLGPVKFKPGNDWIGIQLIGASAGLGRHDGCVQGARYFDCGNKKKAEVFVKMNTQAKMEATVENEVQVDVVTKEKVMSLLVLQNGSKFWGQLLLTDDLSLERASFSL
jgi:dynactin complex subunit